MTPTETAALYLALTETDYTAALALAHEFEDKATAEQFAEYLAALEMCELKDADLDALFHARLVALCKASLPRLALLVPKANGI